MAKKTKSSIGFDPLAWMKPGASPAVSTSESDPTPKAVAEETPAVASTAGPTMLALGDSFTIADVAARYDEWRRVLAGKGGVEIDATRLKTVDTAGLQLLAALARDAEARHVPLRWRASAMLTESAARLGLKETLRLA